ncbi:MAG: DNA translocase FtsK 4TM domain-containing protein [Flavobacteriales bacterium]
MTKRKKPGHISFKPSKSDAQRSWQTVLGLLFIGTSAFLLLAVTSHFFNWRADQSELGSWLNRGAHARNILGRLGAYASHLLVYKSFGVAAYFIVWFLFATGFFSTFRIRLVRFSKLTYNTLFFLLWLPITLNFTLPSHPILGGMLGYQVNAYLDGFIGKLGIAMTVVFSGLFYLVRCYRLTPEKLQAYFAKKKGKRTRVHPIERASEPGGSQADTPDVIHLDKRLESMSSTGESDSKPEGDPIPRDGKTGIDMEISVQPQEKVVTELSPQQQSAEKKYGKFDPRLSLHQYRFPALGLLKEYPSGDITVDPNELERNKDKIVETLSHYKIKISKIKATIGPTVTLYEIVPEAGVRISKIKNLEDDIALSLAALGIRIIAPMPGKGTIGIEVPNSYPTIVSMKSVLSSEKFQNTQMELPIALGKSISNETVVADLTRMPHLLMAGATGQGKSVGINAVLTALLYKKHPAEVKLVLVDPKKVELTLYNKIERHFLAKLPDSEDAIITDNTSVIHTLHSLCIEMDARYELLKNAMVRNIKEYNTKFKARRLNPENGHRFLPYIVLVIDEFSDLIMTAGRELETPLARLAQLARAIGIHLVIATQRPSVNVITGLIKANFPARIAFRVTSKVDSRTILDAGGAEQLIGHGDMLLATGSDIIRLQGAFIDTREVAEITDFIGAQRAYATALHLPEYSGEADGDALSEVDLVGTDRDALFDSAAKIIVESQQGSASLLQRKLKLGYNRAGRIIDQLEGAGIVGPFEGSKARRVLVPDLHTLETVLNALQ